MGGPSETISNAENSSSLHIPNQFTPQIKSYDEALSDLTPNDLMEFEHEWTHEFPKANSIEATNWFNKATSVWQQVDNERQQRLNYLNSPHQNITLETPTNQHNDSHFSDNNLENQDSKSSKSVKKK